MVQGAAPSWLTGPGARGCAAQGGRSVVRPVSIVAQAAAYRPHAHQRAAVVLAVAAVVAA